MSDRVATPPTDRTCPRCGAHEIAEISYGMPAYSTELEADLTAHRVVLGGCVVWQDQPDLQCTACGQTFRADGRSVVAEASW
jgi:transcription elongation factor Elf1